MSLGVCHDGCTDGTHPYQFCVGDRVYNPASVVAFFESNKTWPAEADDVHMEAIEDLCKPKTYKLVIQLNELGKQNKGAMEKTHRILH